MFPVFHLGPLSIQSAGLLMLAGIWIGLTIAEKKASIYHIDAEILYNSIGLGFIVGLLGARFGYILKNIEIFASDPLSMISLNPGLLDIWSGLALGLLAIIIYGQRKKILWLDYLDAITSMLAMIWIAISLANLATGSDYGIPAKLPWAIQLWGELRHPTQVYELIAGMIVLAFMLYPKRPAIFSISGITFFVFIALASGSKIFIDAFRADSTLIFSNFRESQIIAWLILSGALIAIGYLSGKNHSSSQTEENELSRS